MTFKDRTDGGKVLADRLKERGIAADVVLAIPRGGLPAGRAVADALGLPLDVVVARKIGAPENPELAVGAVGPDGHAWYNQSLIATLGIDEEYLEEARQQEAENARQKRNKYRGESFDPAGKRVVVVDDGAATGATALACVRLLREQGASEVTVGLPVASREAANRLGEAADDVVIVETPRAFGAVGRHYREFGQVTDEEAIAYL